MRRIVNGLAVLSIVSLLAPAVLAYCLTGVRLPRLRTFSTIREARSLPASASAHHRWIPR